jgi:hypothetical protein
VFTGTPFFIASAFLIASPLTTSAAPPDSKHQQQSLLREPFFAPCKQGFFCCSMRRAGTSLENQGRWR